MGGGEGYDQNYGFVSSYLTLQIVQIIGVFVEW
jgi:hypothetical protein